MKTRHVVLALVAILLLAGVVVVLVMGHPLERFALFQNRLKWQGQRPANYSFTFETICFCPPQEPLVVQVRNGTPMTTDPNQPHQMEDLFDIVQEAIDGGADEVRVEYDTTYGYITRIAIDSIRQAVDDEVGYRVTNFQILE
jgi:hypothetical protein